MVARILLVEDDENLRLVLADNLEEQGYEVALAADLAQARRQHDEKSPNLVILDLMLPDGDGYSFCRELRSEGATCPILMLTARALESDVVDGLEAGADDYVAKPYRLAELLARIEALLRRSGKRPSTAPYHDRLGSLRIAIAGRIVQREGGQRISLTKTEFDLLACLLARPHEALTRKQILALAWPGDIVVEPRTVDNFVSTLKRKLGWTQTSPWRISTVRGVGYRLELDSAPKD